MKVEDPIVLKVMSKYYERSQAGIKKYGTMLDRQDLTLTDWLTHFQEELMDATLYLERIQKDIELKYIEGYAQGYRDALKNKDHEK